MIETIKGDVLTIDKGFIVHGVNCQGVMGSGIAAQIKKRWPAVFQAYKEKIEIHKASDAWHGKYPADAAGLLGDIQLCWVSETVCVVNAFTQDNYGTHQRQVNYEAVARCFEKVSDVFEKNMLFATPLCFPMIGAGLGGGNWSIISTIIDQTVTDAFTKRLYVLE